MQDSRGMIADAKEIKALRARIAELEEMAESLNASIDLNCNVVNEVTGQLAVTEKALELSCEKHALGGGCPINDCDDTSDCVKCWSKHFAHKAGDPT